MLGAGAKSSAAARGGLQPDLRGEPQSEQHENATRHYCNRSL